MNNETVIETWKPLAGRLFNEAYEECGPGKRDIEDMATDGEYEAQIVSVALSAWEDWKQDGKPGFGDLDRAQQVTIVKAALGSDEAEFGWYRGNANSDKAVNAALDELI